MAEAKSGPPLGHGFETALAYAAQLHARQTRKGTGTPYVSHLLAVAGLVLEYGADEDEAVAALLHDAVEDQGGRETLEEIRRRFGDRVAEIVDGCTDAYVSPKPPWRERKEAYVAHLRSASPSMRLVSAADKLHNARTMLADYRQVGEALWPRFTAGRDETLWYYRAVIAALQAAPTPPAWPGQGLVAELERVVAELEHAVDAHDRATSSGDYTEIEAKWPLAGPPAAGALVARLQELGARPTGARAETNRLFDHPAVDLWQNDQVLRIRVLDGGPGAILTWKGQAEREAGVKRRTEVELDVSDAGRMEELLAGLGYRLAVEYPKQRATWRLGQVEVAVDQLPFGYYCELEGPEAEIRALAPRLGLDPARAERLGYPALMRRHLARQSGTPEAAES